MKDTIMIMWRISCIIPVIAIYFASQFSRVSSFRSISVLPITHAPTKQTSLYLFAENTSSRRDFIKTTNECSILSLITVAVTSISILPENALASGGATAGGAYLLSAKQRYNTRVTKGVSNFVGLKGALEKNDIDTIRTFFSSEEDGSWKDFTSAGYLLANAFRTNSSAPPDNLPSVKKWKAFTAQVEEMTKALKKKDINAALKAHGDAIVALDDYLAKVELTST